jgi:catechol 2,3-dioxygenase-like lactoylglutathione lyase family enzyme
MSGARCYVEHVAIRVGDLAWHLRFFRDALGMAVREVDGPADAPRQVWLHGGPQLVADTDFAGPEGRLYHLGIMTDDLEAAIQAAAGWGLQPMPQGRNWLATPDGLAIELLQARPGSVAAALAVEPRA